MHREVCGQITVERCPELRYYVLFVVNFRYIPLTGAKHPRYTVFCLLDHWTDNKIVSELETLRYHPRENT